MPLRQSTVLETYAETSEPLNRRGAIRAARAQAAAKSAAGSKPTRATTRAICRWWCARRTVLAKSCSWPSIWNVPPLTDWAARPQLFDRLLGKPVVRGTQGDSQSLGQVTTLGFDDLAGQLRGALDQFAEVQLVPFWLVALLLAGLYRLHRAARFFPRRARASAAWNSPG